MYGMRVASFIEQFKKAKEAAGLNNRELAKKLAISEQTVGALLLGNLQTVSDDTAEKIARWMTLNGENIAGYPVAPAGQNAAVAENKREAVYQTAEMTVEQAARFLGRQMGLDWNEVLLALLEAARKKKGNRP